VRYVGKTINLSHRLIGHRNEKKSTRKARWLASLAARNLEPRVEILEVVDADDWQSAEQRWIAFYKASGTDLTNHTSGGEGLNEPDHETRRRISEARRAILADPVRRQRLDESLRSQQRRARISASLAGRKKTEEHVANLPQNKPGWRHTPEARARMSANSSGHRWTAEDIERLREMNRGNKYGVGNKSNSGRGLTKEQREKIGSFWRGKPKGSEQREKMRQARLRYWAAKRAGER
jgi:hypothetical protein